MESKKLICDISISPFKTLPSIFYSLLPIIVTYFALSTRFFVSGSGIHQRYHNTLIVDRFRQEDFLKFENISKAVSTWSLYDKIIVFERLYNQSVTKSNRKTWTDIVKWNAAQDLLNFFPPTFNCPHLLELVSMPGYTGNWICGLNLFEAQPGRPQECVIYMIKNDGDKNSQYILRELENRTDCHILYYTSNKSPLLQDNDSFHSRVQTFNKASLSAQNIDQEMTLRTLMKTNGHAWIDILIVDIGGKEFPILKQIVDDFYEVCPIGQLHVMLHITPSGLSDPMGYTGSLRKFTTWFEALEKKGFRPFHAEVSLDKDRRGNDSIIAIQYAFVNLRGKHLLLTGRRGDI